RVDVEGNSWQPRNARRRQTRLLLHRFLAVRIDHAPDAATVVESPGAAEPAACQAADPRCGGRPYTRTTSRSHDPSSSAADADPESGYRGHGAGARVGA